LRARRRGRNFSAVPFVGAIDVTRKIVAQDFADVENSWHVIQLVLSLRRYQDDGPTVETVPWDPTSR
jgi:hypothetical protein